MDQGEDHINEKDRSIFIFTSLHVILLSNLIKTYRAYEWLIIKYLLTTPNSSNQLINLMFLMW
jgi:hypothetical protein